MQPFSLAWDLKVLPLPKPPSWLLCLAFSSWDGACSRIQVPAPLVGRCNNGHGISSGLESLAEGMPSTSLLRWGCAGAHLLLFCPLT